MVEVVDDPVAAVEGAHAVVTDTWTSMGQEDDRDRRLRDLAGYQVNARLLTGAAPDHVVLHCLPAHCGEEITEDVLWGPQLGRMGRGRKPAARPEGAAGHDRGMTMGVWGV